MKYKILILGNNKNLINQFFDNMGQRLECISSSDRFGDIMNQLQKRGESLFF